MTSNARVYWVHALTPLHVGTGRGIGFVDLPIMREKTTNWPVVPGSTIKGVWRSYAQQDHDDSKYVDVAFGKGTTDEASDHSGSVAVTDARLVLLPVRSFFGTFAYVTSPLALMRLARDLESVGMSGAPRIPSFEGMTWAMAPGDSVINSEGRVYLEDLDFALVGKSNGLSARNEEEVMQWASFFAESLFPGEDGRGFRETLKRRFVILPDSAFDYFSEQGTEVSARIRIDDKVKTASNQGLWYEESLPAETVLSGIVLCERVYGEIDIAPEQLLGHLCKQPISCQVGGKATIGKGFVRIIFSRRETNSAN